MPPPKRLAAVTEEPDRQAVTTPTYLARLVHEEMARQRVSLGDIERRGGPKKGALSSLLRTWRGQRSPNPETLPQLARALGISARTLGRAAAVDMGLLPPDEASYDGLSMLVDALREQADEESRELVTNAARALWQTIRDQRSAAEAAATTGSSNEEVEWELPNGRRVRVKLGEFGVEIDSGDWQSHVNVHSEGPPTLSRIAEHGRGSFLLPELAVLEGEPQGPLAARDVPGGSLGVTGRDELDRQAETPPPVPEGDEGA